MPYSDPTFREEYHRNYMHRWYRENKATHKEATTARKKLVTIENRERLEHLLTHSQCLDCGNKDIRVLEFDHVRGEKHKAVSSMVANGTSWKAIEREIAKCEIVCANCHRIRTTERGQHWRAVGCKH